AQRRAAEPGPPSARRSPDLGQHVPHALGAGRAAEQHVLRLHPPGAGRGPAPAGPGWHAVHLPAGRAGDPCEPALPDRDVREHPEAAAHDGERDDALPPAAVDVAGPEHELRPFRPENRSFRPKGAKTLERLDGGPGTASRSSGATDGFNASAGLTVNRNFGRLQTRTSVRGLLEREDFSSFSASGQDLAVGGVDELPAVKVPSISSSSRSIRSTGYFLNTDLTFDDRYIVNALVRRDGSSLFGPRERWHTYYRVSGAYRMAQEPWWSIDQISELKLRYSRGTAGGRPNFADRFETFSLQTGGGLTLSTL